LGFDSPRVEFRQIEGKLWEIKIKLSSGGHRIFYLSLGKKKMTLLHAYKKQSQKAPSKEIEIAKTRMQEVMNL
jgi:phage-related protein